MQAAAILGAGLLAGVLHALTGPDHLAGVAPLALSAGRRAGWIGLGWGLGHGIGALCAALGALALRETLLSETDVLARVSSDSELASGIFLVALGFLGMRRALSRAAPHVHATRASARTAFALGSVHGAAGLSHLVLALPALALPGSLLPCLYLAGYAAGSLAAIVLAASLLGRLVTRASRMNPHASRLALLFSSTASLTIGSLWIAATL